MIPYLWEQDNWLAFSICFSHPCTGGSCSTRVSSSLVRDSETTSLTSLPAASSGMSTSKQTRFS
jgi:hypothetical protein